MDRLYYMISVLIVMLAFLAFAWRFERGAGKDGNGEETHQKRIQKPRTRELVLIAVLCALTVAGRVAFFMLPQFKPMAAMIILAAVCYGKETGFLVGSVSAFVSNFFFGQGPWTPWQMLAFGLVGYLAGICFYRKKKPVSKRSLCSFGFLAVVLLYGGIVNPASLLMYSQEVTWPAILAVYMSGLPFDLMHAAATVLFLWLLADEMQEKLLRIKKKYGLMNQ